MQRTLTSLLLLAAAFLAPLAWASAVAGARNAAPACASPEADDAPTSCCGGACSCGDGCTCRVERDDDHNDQPTETPALPQNGRDRCGFVLALGLPASAPTAADAPPADCAACTVTTDSGRPAGRALLARISRWTT